MIEKTKIEATHLARLALVYVRQSTATQLERNQESTDRQYRLVERAIELGWKREQTIVIDEDLGRSGSGLVERSGFDKMTSDVALGRVGIILGLEVSRLARNNADWYRLLDLAGMTDTLIADCDGVYHPALFNDRLILGLKGTMSEAELHVIRARCIGAIRNKAARGELRRALPIGLVWGATTKVRSNSIQTRRLPVQFELSSHGLPRWAPQDKYGYGSVHRVCLFRFAKTVQTILTTSVGPSRLIGGFATYLSTLLTRARTHLVGHSSSGTWTLLDESESVCETCLKQNGGCLFASTMKVSSTGKHMKEIKYAFVATRVLDWIKQEEL